ncbi:hypothetical protein C8D97_1222 [Pleionea mediterranea]|uniref:Uncharacterized protein n=1 Tax=Pleionea mediterranea TaxID=523701 RepID=A0A316F7M1_9GAMM|nr:hypothetical protein C8D97_1222 [Pleionea mediterranea]
MFSASLRFTPAIYADIHLPYFIDNKSNLIVELTCNNRSVVKGSVQQFAVPGNGPKTIKLQQLLTNYQNGPAVIELKVRLDVMGDERTVLPISQDWLTESVTKQLGSYQYQQIEKLNNSFGSL